MTTIGNNKAAFLASSNDWELWNLQFQAQAIAGRLWDQIQGLAPFLNKPTAPDLARHKHKTPSQSTITARSSTESVIEEGPDAGSSNQLITIADLTADGFRTYQLEWTIFQAELKEYNKQVETIHQLKQWILTTVCHHYQQVSCHPLESITQWYSALKEQAGITNDELTLRAREAYRQAIKPPVRSNLAKWIETWEQAVSAARKHNVPETLSLRSWFDDFISAIRPTMTNWAISYELVKRSEIKQLTLTYQQVARDLREEVRQARKVTLARGAFGPSFAESAHQGDAFDDDIEQPGRDEGERSGRKRKWDNSPSGRAAKRVECICPACGQAHRLSRCYYLFPEKAPKDFEQRDHIRAKVKKALEDPKLRKKVEKLQDS